MNTPTDARAALTDLMEQLELLKRADPDAYLELVREIDALLEKVV